MWAGILAVALKLLEWILDRAKENKELNKKFYEFLAKREDKIAADLRANYSAQIERIKALQNLRP